MISTEELSSEEISEEEVDSLRHKNIEQAKDIYSKSVQRRKAIQVEGNNSMKVNEDYDLGGGWEKIEE